MAPHSYGEQIWGRLWPGQASERAAGGRQLSSGSSSASSGGGLGSRWRRPRLSPLVVALHARARERLEGKKSAAFWHALRESEAEFSRSQAHVHGGALQQAKGLAALFHLARSPLTVSSAEALLDGAAAALEAGKVADEAACELLLDQTAAAAHAVVVSRVLDHIAALDAHREYWQHVRSGRCWSYALQVAPTRLQVALDPYAQLVDLTQEPATRALQAEEHLEGLFNLLGTLLTWAPRPGCATQVDGLLERVSTAHSRERLSIGEDPGDGSGGEPSEPLTPSPTRAEQHLRSCAMLLGSHLLPAPRLLQPPPALQRAWPTLAAGALIGSVAAYVWAKASLTEVLWGAGVDGCAWAHNFVVFKVVEPLRQIYDSVRYNQESVAMAAPQSLKTDLDSLCRMVESFARDYGGGVDPNVYVEQARTGDISIVLKHWENQIRSPIRSMVTDSMLRTLMIQLQKARTDMDMAVAAADSLLKSQELNFQFASVMPGMVLCYLFGWSLYSLWGWFWAIPGLARNPGLKDGVFDLTKLLNSDIGQAATSKGLVVEGRLFYQAHKLVQLAQRARGIKAANREAFVDDVKELMCFGVEDIPKGFTGDAEVIVWRQRLNSVQLMLHRYFGAARH